MICFAKKSMVPELTCIWQECFHDQEEYIDFFFSAYFTEENMVVYVEDGVPVSMATLMPATVMSNGKTIQVFYVYAVATKPCFQGRGYSKRILSYIREELGLYTFLQPASESLEVFYEKNGYHRLFDRKFLTCNVTGQEAYEVLVAEVLPNKNICSCKVLSEEEAHIYKKIRDKAFQGDGYISYKIEVIRYAIKENAFTGGTTMLVNEQDIIMYRVEENTLIVRETTLKAEYVLSMQSVLFQKEKYQNIVIAVREDEVYEKEKFVIQYKKVYGTFPLQNGGYFNLAFE